MIRITFSITLLLILIYGCHRNPQFMTPGYYFEHKDMEVFEGKWKAKSEKGVVFLSLKYIEKQPFKWNDTIYFVDKIIGDFCFSNEVDSCYFSESNNILYSDNGEIDPNVIRFYMNDPTYGNYRTGILELDTSKNLMLWRLVPASLPRKISGEKNWGKSTIPDSTLYVRITN